MLVGDPLAVPARVVEVEHRRDGVDAQAVDVVAVEPEHGARHQERAHLVAAVVEDAALPLGVEALARVGVLEEMRAVEVAEAVLVVREVRRHPVEDDADAALVQAVDERHEVLRRAVARAGREVAGGLVAPRSVERMLGDRHELDVREAHVRGVVRERIGDLAGSSGCARARTGRAATSPGAPRRSRSAPRAHSRRRAAPSIRRRATRSRATRRPTRCCGGHLACERERVGLVGRVARCASDDAVLVAMPGAHALDAAFPHAGAVAARRERIGAAVPAVPVADDGDAAGVGRPHREVRPGRVGVRAEALVQAPVRALRATGRCRSRTAPRAALRNGNGASFAVECRPPRG